jgi:hypothetical protein
LLASPGFQAHDQWTVQIQAQIQLTATVYIYSGGLSEDEIRAALFIPVRELPSAVNQLCQQFGSRICVLPNGPLSLPSLVQEPVGAD